MSKEYTGAIVIVIVSLANAFGLELGNDVVTALVTGVVGIYVAVARYRKGDITVAGVKS
jgi:energy-converting hydrogenase Eha subunit E